MATRGSEERDRDRGRERILVVCTRYIGDTALAIPFLRNLRAAFPDAVIDVCAEGGARAVQADCPYDDVFVAWRRADGRRGPAAAPQAQAGDSRGASLDHSDEELTDEDAASIANSLLAEQPAALTLAANQLTVLPLQLKSAPAAIPPCKCSARRSSPCATGRRWSSHLL